MIIQSDRERMSIIPCWLDATLVATSFFFIVRHYSEILAIEELRVKEGHKLIIGIFLNQAISLKRLPTPDLAYRHHGEI